METEVRELSSVDEISIYSYNYIYLLPLECSYCSCIQRQENEAIAAQ